MSLLSRTALLSLALMTGNELCVAVFVEPILRALPDPRQIEAVPGFAERLGRVMPLWYAATLLLTAALAVMDYKQGAGLFAPAALSLLLQFAVLALTLTLLVPRNTRLARMSGAYATWKEDARQWDTLHRVRVSLLLLATFTLTFRP